MDFVGSAFVKLNARGTGGFGSIAIYRYLGWR